MRAVAFSCSEPLVSPLSFALQQEECHSVLRFRVKFPVSVAFIVAVVAESGGIIVLLSFLVTPNMTAKIMKGYSR